ncbi:hypothetical protein [Dactylosporangium sp. CA-092794]|uniref:hypothetical protein n=1 Tax=Dactylosporangium sp. CA-092794 TaxID=3239929 RepID=UPI003D8CCB0C
MTGAARGAAIAAGLGRLDIHGPDCGPAPGPGRVVVRDLRGPRGPLVRTYL